MKNNDWYNNARTQINKHMWLPDKSIQKKLLWTIEETNFEIYIEDEDNKESNLERRLG